MATAKANKWRRGEGAPTIRDFVSFSIPGPCTRADAVRKIAEQCGWQLAPLPEQFRRFKHVRGIVIHGSAGEQLDRMTADHENLYWTLSDGVLRFEVRERGNLSPSVELAGRLWREASRVDSGRVSDVALEGIVAKIDGQGFKPTKELEGKDRENVARYNQTHIGQAIKTFANAIRRKKELTVTFEKRDAKTNEAIVRRFNPRRAVRRWLSRCGKKWEKAHHGT